MSYFVTGATGFIGRHLVERTTCDAKPRTQVDRVCTGPSHIGFKRPNPVSLYTRALDERGCHVDPAEL